MTDLLTPVAGLLGGQASSYAEHVTRLGPLPGTSASELLQLVADAGLRGRGGAGFPTVRKLNAVAARGSAAVVANGAEGEPASSKDRVLLTHAPHLVLDGLALAARSVGARSAYLYAPADLLTRFIEPALSERHDRIRVSLVPSPDTFISGQESAVVAAIHGLRAVPTHAATPIYLEGVDRRPTLVQNVETLAQLALIARYGAPWFRQRGLPDAPGTRLLTVSGAIRKPNVYEVPGGSTLGNLITWAGGETEPLSAVLVGGYHGGWVPWNATTMQLPLTQGALAPYEAAPGAGVLVALPQRRCGLVAAAEVTRYLAGQNAGQCGPCLNGMPTLAGLLQALAKGRDVAATYDEILRVVGQVDGRGACQHPSGTVRMVRSALRTFASEVESHLAGTCVAGRSTRRRFR
jgi:NADH:ubiquinone oxidoreductase subunit F (NADH-binding)